MRKIGSLAAFGVSLLALSAPALAQNAAPEDTGTAPEEEIVVTGTLLRGTAPVGAQAISVTQEDIAAVGAQNASQLLASIPAAGTFMAFVGVRGLANFSQAVNRPSLRYLGNSSGGTNSTLLLADGHRLPGMGILQTTPDLDTIASGAIERVEIVTDGGSSIYGSDAVGGVVNFITRKEFDGVEAKARYGFGNDYQEVSASATIGKKWDWGSAYLAYDFVHHDEIFGSDREWSQNLDWVNTAALGRPVGLNVQCAPGNIQLAGVTYALPGLAPGIGNRCDNTETTTIYPRETRHSLFGSFVTDTGGPVSFSLKAFYVNRVNDSDGGAQVQSISVPSTSPHYIPINGSTDPETFAVNFFPAFGDRSTPQRTTLESYGFTPSFKADIGGGWQVSFLGNYGIGHSEFKGQLLNATPIATAAAAGTFNPANLTAATNAATLATARNWFQYGRATNELINARIVADGSLFTLPGGEVRVAVGAEYIHEGYSGVTSRGVTAAGLAALNDVSITRNVKSVFGELNVPVIGEGNGGFIHALSINLSGRYDDYSDFGHTFNPKIGVNLEPTDWLKLRGNWGKAFQAPALSDLAASNSLNLLPLSIYPFADPNTPIGPTQNVIVTLGGVVKPLQPQKATTYSFGFDVKPSLIEGLGFGLTYYNIDFKGAIAIPPIFNPSVFYPQFKNNYVLYTAGTPALQDYLNQIVALAPNPEILAGLPNGINSVYAVFDDRATNLQTTKTSGLDFYARYRRATGFGSVFADLSGTYILTFKTQAFPGAPLLETANKDTTQLRTAFTVGADVGNLRAQVTWNHSGGYSISPTVANLQQNRVGSYELFNLYLQYKVPSESAVFKDLVLSLNVDNLFDQDPPLFRGAGNALNGVANGFSIGRVVKLGVSKRF